MATQSGERTRLNRIAARRAEIDKAKRRAAVSTVAGRGPAADTARQERNRQEREIARRMVKRFHPLMRDGSGGAPDPIVLLYAYWQARRCGWDALSATMRRNANGEPCAPGDSLTWRWWTGLHYTQRRMVSAASVCRVYH